VATSEDAMSERLKEIAVNWIQHFFSPACYAAAILILVRFVGEHRRVWLFRLGVPSNLSAWCNASDVADRPHKSLPDSNRRRVRIQFYPSDVGHGQWPRHSSLIHSPFNSFIFNNYCFQFLKPSVANKKTSTRKESTWTIRYPSNQ
jgi:hypothetical protein